MTDEIVGIFQVFRDFRLLLILYACVFEGRFGRFGNDYLIVDNLRFQVP